MKIFIPMIVVGVLIADWLFLDGRMRASAWYAAEEQGHAVNVAVKRMLQKNM